MVFYNKNIKKILEADCIAIYGAGVMGKNLLNCLNSDVYNKKVDAFIVKDKQDNQDEIDGIKVLDVNQADKFKNKLVVVALHEKYIYSAISELYKGGFEKLLPISFDSDLWTDLRGNWMRSKKIGFDKNTPIVEKIYNRSSIYVVHSNADKKLKVKGKKECFEKEILVGAEYNNNNNYLYKDNTGDNISYKNKEFCELTGLYWIWKNDASEYVGLSHYRRKFVFLGENQEELSPKVDVILTVPIINLTTVKEQYAMDHSINDWNVMMEAIEKLYPNYYQTAIQIGNGHYYYGYNMFITRREIFNNYCVWLFDILDYCEKKIENKNDNYQRRYAGFLAERLLTIYFTYNCQYKIGIARKHFIES